MRMGKSRDRLESPRDGGRLDMLQLYDLMLQAGYSEEIAQREASRRGYERLCAGERM